MHPKATTPLKALPPALPSVPPSRVTPTCVHVRVAWPGPGPALVRLSVSAPDSQAQATAMAAQLADSPWRLGMGMGLGDALRTGPGCVAPSSVAAAPAPPPSGPSFSRHNSSAGGGAPGSGGGGVDSPAARRARLDQLIVSGSPGPSPDSQGSAVSHRVCEEGLEVGGSKLCSEGGVEMAGGGGGGE